MPNHPAVSGAIIVASIAVAAAIAVYESPQARQFAEDIRRRIAVALHSLGDEINPASREPRFNRPEDAEGFLQSQRAIANGEPGVEADEESARRQREELMYWNAVHLEKLEKERKLREAERPRASSRGSSFDDFLQQDKNAEKGTYIYNTGAEVRDSAEEGLRNRGVRGLQRGSVYANPFGDEHNIDMDEQRAIDASLMSPDESERFEVMSEGIYSANEDPIPTRATTTTIAEQLVDTSETVPDPPVMLPEELAPWQEEQNTNFTNPSPRDDSAFASIHAWADNATYNNSFYSPLPTTPRSATPSPQEAAIPDSPVSSDPPESVPGDLTPTDSMSLVGSGDEVWAPRSGATSEGEFMSVNGDDVPTPDTWTEVGSVVSENEAVGLNH